MNEPIVAGDIIRVIDPTSAMCALTGVIMEVDFIDSPEAPYWCQVLVPKQYAPAKCLFARDEIERIELRPGQIA